MEKAGGAAIGSNSTIYRRERYGLFFSALYSNIQSVSLLLMYMN